MSDLVDVRYLKWGGSLHWRMELERLGEDEHGVWLGGRAGIPFWRQDQDARPFPRTFVTLLGSGWWTLQRMEGHASIETYVDITTPPDWDGNDVSVVDLDLDVIREHDGAVKLLDEDEFAEHSVELAYPDEVVVRARETARWVQEEVAARREPFGQIARAWLHRLR